MFLDFHIAYMSPLKGMGVKFCLFENSIFRKLNNQEIIVCHQRINTMWTKHLQDNDDDPPARGGGQNGRTEGDSFSED